LFPVYSTSAARRPQGQSPKFLSLLLPVCLRIFIPCLLILPSLTPTSFIPPLTDNLFMYHFLLQEATNLVPIGRLAVSVPFQWGVRPYPILSLLPHSFLSVFCDACAYSTDAPVNEPDSCLYVCESSRVGRILDQLASRNLRAHSHGHFYLLGLLLHTTCVQTNV